jgi:hypothetical protein
MVVEMNGKKRGRGVVRPWGGDLSLIRCKLIDILALAIPPPNIQTTETHFFHSQTEKLIIDELFGQF